MDFIKSFQALFVFMLMQIIGIIGAYITFRDRLKELEIKTVNVIKEQSSLEQKLVCEIKEIKIEIKENKTEYKKITDGLTELRVDVARVVGAMGKGGSDKGVI